MSATKGSVFRPHYWPGHDAINLLNILRNRYQKAHDCTFAEANDGVRMENPVLYQLAAQDVAELPSNFIEAGLANRLKTPWPEPSGDKGFDLLLRFAHYLENVNDMAPLAAFEHARYHCINSYGPDSPAIQAHLAKLKRAANVQPTRGEQYAADVEASAGKEAGDYVRQRFYLANRAFTPTGDGFFEVLREGEFPHDSGIVQVIDQEALRNIASYFELQKTRPNFPGLLIDFDHFSYDTKQPSEAAGWIQELKIVGNRLLARPDWTDVGETAVKTGRYRLVSPVFPPDGVIALGGKRVRPVKLESVALTNNPNMRGNAPLSV